MGLLEHFHCPQALQKASPSLSDRALLGLPESYTAMRDLAISAAQWRELTQLAPEHLVALLHSTEADLALRYQAGQLLAWQGDPRLSPLAPQMIDIPAAQVSIGLAAQEVDRVMADLADLQLDRDWINKEVPRHRVQLPAYRIGRYPVTNLEYRHFLEDSGYTRLPEDWFLGRYPQERANHPVSGILAEDADQYAAWLAHKTGLAYRLPTEAEWEYAAAGPDNLEYPWGQAFSPLHANTAEAGLFCTTPVGLFALGASPFGCLDMAGNVEEYVADDYQAYPGGAPVTDDLVSATGRHRVARGGSYSRFRDLARCSRRHGKFPRTIYVMGFRLAQSL
ncbi:formylglycine-generating enzyme family protein [Pseudomonas sp. 5P_3.1_Bac2]|uniref:formylglycine-generating enzyme family protein n=1 Tax=Pseudomonas sp. 5P_3.1_Bac2 TaxID=2971617 RepID=UPI0021C7ED7C|nr:formylglycine-generating enzyme family protein [Pseudomonas sp. 5P_3.1_Bac2]MCU1718137.1 formylglycine-generating enzyme family protein [Pseudomonas sp. 5P_3.1_Bac2]